MDDKNLLTTILFASAFGLICCLLWGVLYWFGYLAMIGAFATYYLVSFGYKKFAGRNLVKKDCSKIFIITLVEIILTDIIMNVIALNVYTEYNFFKAFVVIITRFSGLTGLLWDILFSFILILILYIRDRKNHPDGDMNINYSSNELNEKNTSYNSKDDSTTINYGDGFSITYDEGVLEEENQIKKTDNENQN